MKPFPAARPSPLLACALVGIASAALYRPTLDSGFIALDDPQYVGDNPYILWPTWEKFTGFFTEWEKPATVAGYYQPLTLASLTLDRLIERSLAGEWPMPPQAFVYHLSNIAIHGVNSALVCLLAWALTRNRLAAAVCGLLFGLHPLNVEVVAWVNQRKALLSTTFALLMLFAHVRYARSRRIVWAIATFVAFLLSLLSKPTGLLLPVVLLLVDVWPLRRFSLRCVLEKLPLAALAAVLGYVAYRSQHLTTGLSRNVAADDPWRALLVMCHNLSFYIAKTIVPVRLSPFYPIPPDGEITLGNRSFLLGMLGAIGIGVLMLVAIRRRWHSVWVCLASFILLAAPALGSVRFMAAIAADRFAYMPMIAAIALLAHGLRRRLAWDRIEKRTGLSPSMRLIAVLVAFVVLWGSHAYSRQRTWSSSRAYYASILAHNPGVAEGPFGMGICDFEDHDKLMQAGVPTDDPGAQALLDDAERNFRAALALSPSFGKAASNVAQILLLREKPVEALPIIEIGVQGGDSEAYFFLGLANSRLGQDETAVNAYRQYLSMRPGHRESLRNIGNSLVRLGRSDEALPYFEQLVGLDPLDVDAFHNYGAALLATNQPEAALNRLGRAIQLRRARISELEADPARRERALGKELTLMAESQYLFARGLAQLGRIPEAVKLLTWVVRLKPDMADAIQRDPSLSTLRESEAWRQAAGATVPATQGTSESPVP